MDGLDYRAALRLHKNGPVEADIRAHLAACRDRGITRFRDGGDALGVSCRAADLAAEYGIAYVTPAFAVHRQGRYGSIVGRAYEDLAEYRALVAQARDQGADFIKLMFSGLLDFNVYGRISCPPLPAEEIRELVHIAHGEGFPVMAHVNGAGAVRAALEAGTDSVEHGYYMDGDCAALLAETGAVWVPTLAAIHAFRDREGFSGPVVDRLLAEQGVRLRQAAAAGALIASGSDSGAVGVPHGEGLHRELGLLSEALGPGWEAVIEQGNAALWRRFSPRRGH